MASLDIAPEDTQDGSPTIPPIPPITDTATTAADDNDAADADTTMTASTAQAADTSTTNATTDADNTTNATTTSNNGTVHRIIKTQRKVAKRTPFPIAAAPVTVEEEEEGTTAIASQVLDDTHTAETETSAVKVTQEQEGEEEEQVSDDPERRDATASVTPVPAADSTPPTPTNKKTTANTMKEADTARILKMAVEPHLNDVLFVDDNCEEDSKINKKWPGNRQYRAWIHARVVDFQHASSRSEQTRLARQVIGLVRLQNPKGRFLERLSYPADSSNINATTATKSKIISKTKSVWVELDETAVLMELSKSLWEAPLENHKLSDKQQQMLAKRAPLQADSDDEGSSKKNGDNNKKVHKKKGNGANASNIENEGFTARQEQELLLQHAKASSHFGDYFHTLYITPVYSNSQSPSANTAASMMQQKQERKKPPHKRAQEQKQQRKPTLNKSASASTKRRPSLDKSKDLPPNGYEDVFADINVGNDGDNDDSKSEQSRDRGEKSVEVDGKLGKNDGNAKRKSISDDKKPKPKRSSSTDKAKLGRNINKKVDTFANRGRRVSTGSMGDTKKETVSPLSVPSEPALKKRKTGRASTSSMEFTSAKAATKTGRGANKVPRSSSTTPNRKKPGEKKSYNNKDTATDELGLPRGVTMRPSGKWQAQFYFAGQSRYIGVFQSAYDAAAAYEIVRERLDTARRKDSRGNSTLTKEARSQLFDDARRAAHEGVFENKEDSEAKSSLNYANKMKIPPAEDNDDSKSKSVKQENLHEKK